MLNDSLWCKCVYTGSTGTRTMWAWWKMAQWCLRTTQKALCSWERSRWEIQLWISSPQSTSLDGWVWTDCLKQMEGNGCSAWASVFFFMCFNLVISFCILLLRSSFLYVTSLMHFYWLFMRRLSWTRWKAISSNRLWWTLWGLMSSPTALYRGCSGGMKMPCWPRFLPVSLMWRQHLASCTRYVSFSKQFPGRWCPR